MRKKEMQTLQRNISPGSIQLPETILLRKGRLQKSQ